MNLFETFKCLEVADGISSSFYNLCFSYIPLQEIVCVMFRLLQTLSAPFLSGHTMLVDESSAGTTYMMIQQVCYIGNWHLATVDPTEIKDGKKYTMEHFRSEFIQILLNCGLKVKYS